MRFQMKNVEWLTERSVRVTITAGYEGGRQKRYRDVFDVEGKTETAQRRFIEGRIATLRAKVERGEATEKHTTVEAFSKMWMKDYIGSEGFSPKTESVYECFLRLHILPALGNIRLDKLNAPILLRFLKDLSNKPNGKGGHLSGRTVKDVYIVLRSMLNKAVEWQYLPRSPLANVPAPKNDTKTMHTYTWEECRAVLDALESERIVYRAAITLALFTGMRMGEIAGLDWAQVDFDNKVIHIEQQAQAVVGQGVILKAPKTEAGKRTVSVPTEVVDTLKALRAHQREMKLAHGSLWADSEAVFVNEETGKRLYPNTISVQFRAFQTRHNIRRIRFHELRHTAASLAYNAGANDIAIAAQLGHTSPNTTRSFYAHAIPGLGLAPSERIAEEIRKPRKKTDAK